MNKLYIIVPLLLLGIFGFFYNNFTVKHAAEVAEEEAAAEVAAAEKAAEKAEAERRSKEDAARRTAEREAAEAQKVAERNAKWEAASAEIARYTNEAKSESDKHQAKINELELKLTELRKSRETLNNEAFQLMKDVEAARITKRNAEMQVQRMAQMVTRKAETSVLVKSPIPAPEPTGRR